MLPRDPHTTLILIVLGVEAVALIVAVVILLARGPRGRRAGRVARAFDRFAQRRRSTVAGVFLLSLSLSILMAAIHRPVPRIHDEFSYLLAADTFSHGRLTNPTHPLWEHFESEHIIQRPTYTSKYPPAQGLVLALGQVLLGSPLVGAWLATAAACAAICWMLQGWMPARWALLGGMLAAIHPGCVGWWGHSYWGGALAALGGAMVFGAVRRMGHAASKSAPRGRRWHGAILGAGLAILANTRPYEGLMAAIPAGLALAALLLGPRRPPLVSTLTRVAIPALLILIPVAAWDARYNEAVTGRSLQMPYQSHWSQYCATPMFLFQGIPPEPVYRDRKLRDFHAGWELEIYREQRRTVYRGFRKGVHKAMMFWGFYFGPALTVGLVRLLPVSRRRRRAARRPDPWVRFALAAVLWSLATTFICVWFHAFYVAPIAGLLILLAVEGLRRLRASGPGGPALYRAVVQTQVVALAGVFIATPIVYTGKDWSSTRAAINNDLAARGGKHLVIVRNGRDYQPMQEYVYNGADIDGSPVVWARELESTSVPALLDYYKDRTVWLLQAYRIDSPSPAIVPYPRVPAWLSAPALHPAADNAVAAVAAGRLGASGAPTVVLAPAARPELRLLTRNADGGFAAVTVRVPATVSAIVLADFDGDGATDLACASAAWPEVFVLRADPAGSFEAPVTRALPGPARGLVAIRTPGRAGADLAATCDAPADAAGVYLLRDPATPAASEPAMRVARVGPVAAAEWSGDGMSDLAAVVGAEGRVVVLSNTAAARDGERLFTKGRDAATGRDPTAIAAADLDGDGVPEIIVSNGGEDTLTVASRMDNGMWTWKSLNTGIHPTGIAVADIDGDGRPDLCVSTLYGHGLTILRNAGGLKYEAPAEVTLHGTTWFQDKSTCIAAADLDGDGIADLVVGTVTGCDVLLSGTRP